MVPDQASRANDILGSVLQHSPHSAGVELSRKTVSHVHAKPKSEPDSETSMFQFSIEGQRRTARGSGVAAQRSETTLVLRLAVARRRAVPSRCSRSRGHMGRLDLDLTVHYTAGAAR